VTPERAYRLGERAALAQQRGDDAGSRALFADVVRESTRLWRAGKRDQAHALAEAWEDGNTTATYREVRAMRGVE
jgi:hypothetical protein